MKLDKKITINKTIYLIKILLLFNAIILPLAYFTQWSFLITLWVGVNFCTIFPILMVYAVNNLE